MSIPAQQKSSEQELQSLIAASDTGSRKLDGLTGKFVILTALAWSVYQLLLASPISNYVLSGDLINNSRQIHLAFALFLAAMAYPLFGSSSRTAVPVYDWILACLGVFFALYGYFFYEKIVNNGGLADSHDAIVALGGIIILLIATYRTFGPVLPILAIIFLLYVFFGSSEIVPNEIRWAGASLRRAMSHMWTTSEGVFGIALGVSTKFVFLFVLFGALLDKAGAGNYFIKMAFGALGHLRGGPAKAAVVGSAATGLISGSSIANVVTTGTFTIPLMRRVGFSAEKSGAVEVASSVNGQIMPPVMGAAAFLMIEYIGISYVEVITHAILPALISYISLVYIVHLEAVKNRMPVLGNKVVSIGRTLGGMLAFFAGFALLCYTIQFPIRFISYWVPEGSVWIIAILLILSYVALIWVASKSDDLVLDDPNTEIVELPDITKIYSTGLYYLLPIITLVYLLMIERKSPGLSAFWASLVLMIILLTQKPLKTFFRSEAGVLSRFGVGVEDLFFGMIDGARNMIGIGVATAVAGIIVGTVSLTGIGQVMGDFVNFLSGGNLILMLVFVAILSLILGMGLPTTANYIVVSSLMVAVIVELGAEAGLVVPLVAVHLFVFYFGIMADVTPPVGLASFAAAAVSGGDSIRTGLTAFFYSLRTIVLPFIFIFNTDLLLIDVTWVEAIIVFIASTIGILIFTATTMGWFVTRSRIVESLCLLWVSFAFLHPGFFINRIQPPFTQVAPIQFVEALKSQKPGNVVRVILAGPDFDTGAIKELTLELTVPNEAGQPTDISALGLDIVQIQDKLTVAEPPFGSALGEKLKDFDFYADQSVHILSVKFAKEQLPKEIIFVPAFLLLGFIMMIQYRRARHHRKEHVI